MSAKSPESSSPYVGEFNATTTLDEGVRFPEEPSTEESPNPETASDRGVEEATPAPRKDKEKHERRQAQRGTHRGKRGGGRWNGPKSGNEEGFVAGEPASEVDIVAMTDPENILDLKADYERAREQADRDASVPALNMSTTDYQQRHARNSRLKADMIKAYMQVGRDTDNPRLVPDEVETYIADMVDRPYGELESMLQQQRKQGTETASDTAESSPAAASEAAAAYPGAADSEEGSRESGNDTGVTDGTAEDSPGTAGSDDGQANPGKDANGPAHANGSGQPEASGPIAELEPETPSTARDWAEQYVKDNVDLTGGSTEAGQRLIEARDRLATADTFGNDDTRQAAEDYIQARKAFLAEQSDAAGSDLTSVRQQALLEKVNTHEDGLLRALQSSLRQEAADQEVVRQREADEYEEEGGEEAERTNKIQRFIDRFRQANLKMLAGIQVRWELLKQYHNETFFSDSEPERAQRDRRLLGVAMGAVAMYAAWRGYEAWQDSGTVPEVNDITEEPEPEVPETEPEVDDAPDNGPETDSEVEQEVSERAEYLYGELAGQEHTLHIAGEGREYWVWVQLEQLVEQAMPEADYSEKQRYVGNLLEALNAQHPDMTREDFDLVHPSDTFNLKIPVS